jgi:hypothetical protein
VRLLAKPFIGQSQVKQGRGIVRIELHGALEDLKRGGKPVLFDIQVPEPHVGGLMTAVQGDGLAKQRLCRVEVTVLGRDQS